MIAYRRGSQSLAGAASVKHRVPAIIGAFRLDIAHWVEQQTDNLSVAGSNPAIQTLTLPENSVHPCE